MRTTSTLAVLATLAGLASTSSAQRITTLLTQPRIGSTLDVQYAGTAGDVYAMFLSAPSAASTPIPGIGGNLLLDLNSILLVYFGTVLGLGFDVVGMPIPNNLSLVGGSVELQPLNIATGPVFDFGVNDVLVTFNQTGRTVLFQGTSPTSTTTGTLDVQLSTNNNVGAPTTQGIGSYNVQTIQHYGQEGWVEAYAHSFAGTPFYQDINAYKRNRPARNMATGTGFQSLVLNATRDLMIVRSSTNTREFALMTIDVTSGAASILSGTVQQDNVSTSATPTSIYHSQVAVSDDGNLVGVAVRDTTLTTTAYNRVWLVRTDGSTWAASGTAVLDVSIAQPTPAYYTQTLFFANGRFFAGGSYSWQSCPTDGTGLMLPVGLPNTGIGGAAYWIYSPAWRVSRDRQTVALPIGSNTGSSADSHDIVSITGISAAGLTVQNASGFTTNTALQRFFGTATYTFSASGASSIGKRVDLSPDGSRVAFLSGTNLAADPTQLYVAKTDGSQAGTLVSPTAGLFDPQVVYMCGVEFVTNNTVLFWAGTTHTSTGGNLDLYAYDVTLNTVTNLTKTSTGSHVAPFTQGGNTGNIIVHSTFKSENNNWLYFVRGVNLTLSPGVFRKNIVGVDVNTLAFKDITGSEFSAGTAPDIYRGATSRTTDPYAAVETMLKRSPVGDMAYFTAENAAGATASLYNDANIFGFDIENGGQAVQLTSYATAGGTTSTVNYIQSMNISPDGQTIAFAKRTGLATTTSEDVFVIATSAVLGTPTQLSTTTASGQTITDGSIQFTGAPVNAVVWSRGTGSTTVPTANTVAQWRPISGSGPVVNLSEAPVATPAKGVLVHSANSQN